MSTLQTTNLKHPDAAGNNIAFDSSGHATFSNTVKTSKIENANTSNGGVEIDSDGHVQLDGQQMPTAGALSNRNMIINGAMRVNQKGESSYTSQNGDNNRGADRWVVLVGTSPAVLTHSVELSGGPDGFDNWLKVSPSTADTSITSTEYSTIQQHIEGYTFAQARYGHSDAKPVAVSFRFKTNKAGTYCMIHRNQAGNRNYLYEFTPTADGTWQTISYTVPGDTTGTWQNDEQLGWRFELCLANGPSYHSSTVESWFSGQYFHSTPNQVNFLDSTSNEMGITGVQVELGEKPTPFEHRSYGDELAACQRFYQRYCLVAGNDGAPVMRGSLISGASELGFTLPSPMRAAPSISNLSTNNQLEYRRIHSSNDQGNVTIANLTSTHNIDNIDNLNQHVRVRFSPALVDGEPYALFSNGQGQIVLEAEAEI